MIACDVRTGSQFLHLYAMGKLNIAVAGCQSWAGKQPGHRVKRSLRSLIIVALITTVSSAEEGESRHGKWSLGVQNVIDTASALPPEFSADALMDVVESGWVTDKSRRLKLLRHAFEQAALVQQALKKRLAIDAQTDSRSGFQHLAFTLNLDRISLQTRAVNDLLPFDSDKAKDWFDEIRFPELDPIGCDETLVYDPSSYYKTLANLAREAFSRSQKMDGHRFAWLIGHLARIQSHTQIAPIAYELSSADLDLPPRELQDSAALLAAELQTMRGDQQSFSF